MAGRRLGLKAAGPTVGAEGSVEKKPGRFRLWLRANAVPLAAGVALIALAGTVTLMQPDENAESAALSLYKKGKTKITDLTFDDKLHAWTFEVFRKGKCGENFPKVLGEIQDELLRLSEAGDTEGADSLLRFEHQLTAGREALLKQCANK